MSEEAAPNAGQDLTASPEASSATGATDATDTAADAAPWYDSFSSHDKAYLSTKGWDKPDKGPSDILKSYRNLEKMRGVSSDELVRLPHDEKSTEEFYQRLGVPEEAGGYETPPTTVAGAELDGSVLSNISHGLKHTPEQHKAFVEAVGTYLETEMSAQQTATYERDSAEKLALEREWGGRAEENFQAAAKAANRFGIDTELMDKIQAGLGYRGTVELFTRIGRSFGEAGGAEAPRGTDSGPYGMTPDAAKVKLSELRGDAGFRQKLMEGDADAKARWAKLNEVAFHNS